jgi:pimeloyl-ACP methyl ester carboxylesterase
MSKEKHRLVIIHSFPANSILLKGLYDFLSDFFEVYPIDLPGFVKNIKPLEEITLENYIRYVETEIEKLGIEDYWIGGVSFGFTIANLARNKSRCKGVISITPYLGSSFLNIPLWIRSAYVAIIYLLQVSNLFYKVWYSSFIRKSLLFIYNVEIGKKIKIIFDEVDARTFFETLKILLLDKQDRCVFINRPYVLIINENDETVASEKILRKFEEGTDNLAVVYTTAEHSPDIISKEYFKENVRQEDVTRMIDFVERF